MDDELFFPLDDPPAPPAPPPETSPYNLSSLSGSLTLRQAARALSLCQQPYVLESGGPALDEVSPAVMAAELQSALSQDGSCEEMLFMQAQVLDSLFNRLISKIFDCPYSNKRPGNFIDNERMLVALRAQRQTRQTVEALRALQQKRSEPKRKNRANELKDSENES